MTLRPLLLSAVLGIASLGLFHSPTAEAQGYVSISVGTPQHHRPYYGQSRYGNPYGSRYDMGRNGYPGGHHSRSGYTLVPGHWVRTAYGRQWMPAQYVRVQPRGYRRGYGGTGHGGYRVIHRPVHGYDPRYGYPPRRGW